MSYAVSGIDGKVKTNANPQANGGGTTVDMDVTGYDLDVEVVDIDSTTTADEGWEDGIDGTKKISGSFDFFWNPSKSPFSAVASLMPGSGTYPTLTFVVDAANNYSGIAKINKLSLKSSTKTGKTFTATFRSKGSWSTPS